MKDERTLMIESPAPLACLDAKMNFISANNKFVDELNLLPSSLLIGKPFSQYFDSLEVLINVERYIKSDQLEMNYIQKVLVERKLKSYKFYLKKLFTPNLIIAIYAEDQTELFEKIQELDALKATTVNSSRMAILGEMAAGIAHEINNPLVIIAGLTDQVLRATNNPGEIPIEEVVKKLHKIKTTSNRIGKIVKGLKSYSRDGSSDPFEANIVKELINDSLTLCTDQLRSHEIQLIVDDIDPAIKLDCRGSEISQVILNLISNSKDAIKNEPTEKWIRIGAREIGSHIEFYLSDSGKGIKPEIREKILQPFFTTKAVGEGTGLGLAITKKIIDSHFGNLSLDSKSKNTTFVFSIPKGLSNHLAVAM